MVQYGSPSFTAGLVIAFHRAAYARKPVKIRMIRLEREAEPGMPGGLKGEYLHIRTLPVLGAAFDLPGHIAGWPQGIRFAAD